MKKKIVSFSLWGDGENYTLGAVLNADIAKEQWPDWICRYYVAPSVPSAVLEELESRDNVEIVREQEISDILDVEIQGGKGWEGEPLGMFWRMLAAAEEDVEVVIIRDTDSRLHIRDKKAVEEWLQSDKKFHIMRDNCQHGFPICGGLWGVRDGALSDIVDVIKEYLNNENDASNHDQIFLKKLYRERVVHDCYVHDQDNWWFPNVFVQEEKHAFPIPRLKGEGWWNTEFPDWHGGIEDNKDNYPWWFEEGGQGHCYLKCPACGQYHDNEYLGKSVPCATKAEKEKYSHLIGIKA